MTRYLLDTNVISALRAPDRQGDGFRRWLEDTDLAQCSISTLTRMELRTGALKKVRTDPARGRLIDAWRQSIVDAFAARTLPFGDLEADVCAALWLLRPRGTLDTLIAATALAHGMTVATRNVADFADIPELALVNPWAPGDFGRG